MLRQKLTAARMGAPAKQSTGASEASEADERERRADSLVFMERNVMERNKKPPEQK